MDNFARYQKSIAVRGSDESIKQYIIRKITDYVAANRSMPVKTRITFYQNSPKPDFIVEARGDPPHNLLSFHQGIPNGNDVVSGIFHTQSDLIVSIIWKSEPRTHSLIVSQDNKRIHKDIQSEHAMILNLIPSHILTPDVMRPRRNARAVVTFFPDNYPAGGAPIILSRVTLMEYCDPRFSQDPAETAILTGISGITEGIVAAIEDVLDGARFGLAIKSYDTLGVDETKVFVAILQYLGVVCDLA